MCMILAVSAVLEVGVGDMAKILYHVFLLIYNNFITIHLSCWFYYFDGSVQPKLFPYYKDKAFQGKKY